MQGGTVLDYLCLALLQENNPSTCFEIDSLHIWTAWARSSCWTFKGGEWTLLSSEGMK